MTELQRNDMSWVTPLAASWKLVPGTNRDRLNWLIAHPDYIDVVLGMHCDQSCVGSMQETDAYKLLASSITESFTFCEICFLVEHVPAYLLLAPINRCLNFDHYVHLLRRNPEIITWLEPPMICWIRDAYSSNTACVELPAKLLRDQPCLMHFFKSALTSEIKVELIKECPQLLDTFDPDSFSLDMADIESMLQDNPWLFEKLMKLKPRTKYFIYLGNYTLLSMLRERPELLNVFGIECLSRFDYHDMAVLIHAQPQLAHLYTVSNHVSTVVDSSCKFVTNMISLDPVHILCDPYCHEQKEEYYGKLYSRFPCYLPADRYELIKTLNSLPVKYVYLILAKRPELIDMCSILETEHETGHPLLRLLIERPQLIFRSAAIRAIVTDSCNANYGIHARLLCDLPYLASYFDLRGLCSADLKKLFVAHPFLATSALIDKLEVRDLAYLLKRHPALLAYCSNRRFTQQQIQRISEGENEWMVPYLTVE